jgi:Ca2+-binding EF-hand superfamily protein
MPLPKLSGEQAEEFKQVFSMMDANGDGKISHSVPVPPPRNY